MLAGTQVSLFHFVLPLIQLLVPPATDFAPPLTPLLGNQAI
jgi:hypothetical protein